MFIFILIKTILILYHTAVLFPAWWCSFHAGCFSFRSRATPLATSRRGTLCQVCSKPTHPTIVRRNGQHGEYCCVSALTSIVIVGHAINKSPAVFRSRFPI
ncbi:unnamed protein product, partial [Laminaria digitata]